MKSPFTFTKLLVLSIIVTFSLSTLILKHPKDLRESFEKGKIDATYANFGFNPYGYTITGKIYYAYDNNDADLACNLEKLLNANIKFDENSEYERILLIDRGACHFVTKARNAQELGAKGIIIVNYDDTPLDSVIMADDGTGSDITIPLIMISKTSGDILKAYYKNKVTSNKQPDIILDLDFQIESFDNKAYVDLFFSSYNEEIYKLFYDFELYEFFEKLGEDVIVNPYYVTFRDFSFNNTSDTLASRKIVPNCLGGGKYCAMPFQVSHSAEELETLNVNLIQHCVFKVNNEKKTKSYSYFYYMIEYYFICMQSNIDSSKSKCAQEIIFENNDEIMNCYRNVYENNGRLVASLEVDNIPVFDVAYNIASAFNIRTLPTILINGTPYRGLINGKGVIEAICAGIRRKPDVCFTDGGFKRGSGNGKLWAILITISALLIGISIIVFVLCRRNIQSKISSDISSTELDNRVNTVVTNYLALKDKN